MAVALWLAAVCAVALGYPDGAPDDVDVLSSMLPHHFPGPQRGSTSPYELEVTETNGTLRMLIDGQLPHRGFLIKVAGAEDGQLGAFQQPPPPGCRLLANGAAATHTSSESRQQTLVVWTLPAIRQKSTYVIYYTVVLTFSRYWANLNRTLAVSAAETSELVSTLASPAAAAASNNSSTATSAIAVQEAATFTSTDAESGEPIISTEQQLAISQSPAAATSPSPLINTAPAAAASTDEASATVIVGITTAQHAAAVANTASREPAILADQQLFTGGSPPAAAEALPPASPVALSSGPAAYANTILVASLTAAAAGAQSAG